MLLRRRFDRQTNPAVDELVADRPELFTDWCQADFDELYSRMGTGGALTADGALASAEAINRKRELHDKLRATAGNRTSRRHRRHSGTVVPAGASRDVNEMMNERGATSYY